MTRSRIDELRARCATACRTCCVGHQHARDRRHAVRAAGDAGSGAARAPAAHRDRARRPVGDRRRAPDACRTRTPPRSSITSGTTGEPRGAVLTRSALRRLGARRAPRTSAGEADDAGCCACRSRAWAGCRSSRAASRRAAASCSPQDSTPGASRSGSPGSASRWLSLVPTMLTRVLDAHPDWTAPAHLRAVLLGGAAASPRLLSPRRRRGACRSS